MRSAREIWEAALGQLQIQISKPNFDTWLKDTIGLNYHNNCFTIGVPNVFVGEWLDNRWRSLIAKTLVGIIGKDTIVQFSLHTKDQSIAPPTPTSYIDGGLSSRVTVEAFPQPKLNPKYTFNTFIVGNCNRLAYSAALEVAQKLPEHYNPLFICSGTGLGKTHLLHAIGHQTMSNGLRTVCFTAEQFTNEFVKSLREGESEGFRHKFRNVQVLLIDDIYFFSGKGKIQEYFTQIFSELYHANAHIVITSDHSPKAMPLFNNRLRSRLEWGLVADLLPPEIETRLAILKTKTEERGLKVTPEVLQFLAEKCQENIRELVGAFNRVVARSQVYKATINLSFAEEALAKMTIEAQKETSPNPVIDVVARHFGLTPELLKGEKRDRKTSLARQIAIYLMREENHCTLSQISQEFNNRDHSTILYNYQQIKKHLNNEPKLRNQIAEILRVIKYTREK